MFFHDMEKASICDAPGSRMSEQYRENCVFHLDVSKSISGWNTKTVKTSFKIDGFSIHSESL